MKPINQYNSLAEFTSELEKNKSRRLPFKIMGKERLPKKGRRGIFHSFSMLGYLYGEFQDPDAPNMDFNNTFTPVGKLLKESIQLDSTCCYSSITPNPKGENLFQGDIVRVKGMSLEGRSIDYVMLLSHSCDISNQDVFSVFPVFIESKVSEDLVTYLKGQAPKSWESVLSGWLSNRNKFFLGLPPTEFDKMLDEQLLVALNKPMSCNTDDLIGEPLTRLTYRALGYFQARIALLYLRDVYDSDESREV